jgi:hypothetical protein
MKVQLRRWCAIGVTSGALAVSMIAGSGAVGASANADAEYAVANNQPNSVVSTVVSTDTAAIIIPSNVAPSFMDPTYLDNR